MNERLKELAEKTGVTMLNVLSCYEEEIKCFADLVRQDEREACAKVCLELVQAKASGESYEDGTIDCAKAIRARSEPNPAFKNYMGDNWAGIV